MAGREVRKTRDVVLECVVRYIQVHGYPPSVRELRDMSGLKSTNTVHSHLKRLLIEGRLETDAEYGTPRALRVPGYKFVKGDNNCDEDR